MKYSLRSMMVVVGIVLGAVLLLVAVEIVWILYAVKGAA
jgi:hypothetical protein